MICKARLRCFGIRRGLTKRHSLLTALLEEAKMANCRTYEPGSTSANPFEFPE